MTRNTLTFVLAVVLHLLAAFQQMTETDYSGAGGSFKRASSELNHAAHEIEVHTLSLALKVEEIIDHEMKVSRCSKPCIRQLLN